MPLTFLNGGSPNFTGEPVFDGNSTLVNFRDTLITAGWVLESQLLSGGDTVGDYVILRATSLVGSFNCWVRVSILDNSDNIIDGYKIGVELSQNVGFTIASPIYEMTYIGANTESRLWIAADEESFCVSLRSFNGLMIGIHGGFLERVEPLTDQYAYAIGYLATIGLTNQYRVAKGAIDTGNWTEILNRDYFRGSDSNLLDQQASIAPTQGTFDRYTTVVMPFINFESSSASNVGRNAQNGQLNGLDGRAILGEYFITEGLGGQSTYSTTGNLGVPLYYRGNVKFAIVGVASLIASAQVEDSGGTRYLSTGGLGYQGFQITP